MSATTLPGELPFDREKLKEVLQDRGLFFKQESALAAEVRGYFAPIGVDPPMWRYFGWLLGNFTRDVLEIREPIDVASDWAYLKSFGPCLASIHQMEQGKAPWHYRPRRDQSALVPLVYGPRRAAGSHLITLVANAHVAEIWTPAKYRNENEIYIQRTKAENSLSGVFIDHNRRWSDVDAFSMVRHVCEITTRYLERFLQADNGAETLQWLLSSDETAPLSTEALREHLERYSPMLSMYILLYPEHWTPLLN